MALAYALVLTERDLLKVEALEHMAAARGGDTGVQEVMGGCYGLTDREVEVLKYLVLGRSSRRIQEELLISESTVHTHARHIYQKLGIHSKQELLDMVEELRGR